ncbi:hypothetical protein CC2G_003891 [Coprinopsis cinerea AmutBmut pab1-1]|nr:hypothetical protein CC2G_003891 [Coprinopsis cinerea AmutBmut pab1-1]
MAIRPMVVRDQEATVQEDDGGDREGKAVGDTKESVNIIGATGTVTLDLLTSVRSQSLCQSPPSIVPCATLSREKTDRRALVLHSLSLNEHWGAAQSEVCCFRTKPTKSKCSPFGAMVTPNPHLISQSSLSMAQSTSRGPFIFRKTWNNDLFRVRCHAHTCRRDSPLWSTGTMLESDYTRIQGVMVMRRFTTFLEAILPRSCSKLSHRCLGYVSARQLLHDDSGSNVLSACPNRSRLLAIEAEVEGHRIRLFLHSKVLTAQTKGLRVPALGGVPLTPGR